MHKVIPGDKVSADRWNKLPDEIIARIVNEVFGEGIGVYFTRPGGNRLLINADSGASPTNVIQPFQAIPQGGPGILWVAKGTLNSMDEDSGLTVFGLSGTQPAAYWQFALPPNSTKVAVLDATLDSDGGCSAAKFSLYSDAAPTTGAGDPDTGSPPPHAYRAIFQAVTDSNYNTVITPYTTGAQQIGVYTQSWDCTSVTMGVFWAP
jgi:hypothetical protein